MSTVVLKIGQRSTVKKFIKTQCGLDKYDELGKRTGVLNRIRWYWFIFFASLRDSVKTFGR